ncbi:UNVERIFIED_CONTAM: hypothetical protein HDU68_001696, partial [Siphonaria sp. JEL0065]
MQRNANNLRVKLDKPSCMQFLILTVALFPLARAQGLFEGSNCNLNVANFGSASDAFITGGKIDYVNGVMTMTMTPPTNASDPDAYGFEAIVTSKLYLLYGSVEVTLKQAPIGGIVTYLTLINQQTKDEIDVELIGNERTTFWTNFFYKGLREIDPVKQVEKWSANPSTSSDNNQNWHTYRIDWLPDSITWSVDGAAVHVQTKADTFEKSDTGDMAKDSNGKGYDHFHYPVTPLTVNLGIWNSQSPIWANGPINWKDPATRNGFSAQVASLKVSCYTPPPLPSPTGPAPVASTTSAIELPPVVIVTAHPPPPVAPTAITTAAQSTDSLSESATSTSVTRATSAAI